jgi:hypothetical protein
VNPVLPAMPIDVVFLISPLKYEIETRSSQADYQFRILGRHSSSHSLEFLDAYSLRDSFLKLKSPEEALGLLSLIGQFRRLRDDLGQIDDALTWSEIVGWQKLIRKLQKRSYSEWFPLLPVRMPEEKALFFKWQFWTNETKDFLEHIWQVSDETYFSLQGIPEGLMIRRDMYLTREETWSFFTAPGATVYGSLAWHHAHSNLQKARVNRARGNSEGKQKLVAEIVPTSALNAILATVYIEKLRGLDLRLCALKECNETFIVESNHGKAYCGNYHAHLASVRRRRAEAKKERDRQARKKEKGNEHFPTR